MGLIHGDMNISITQDTRFETFGVFCHNGVYFSLEFRIRAVYAYKLLKQQIVNQPSTNYSQRDNTTGENSLTDQLVSCFYNRLGYKKPVRQQRFTPPEAVGASG